MGLGIEKLQVDLRGTRSVDEVIQRINRERVITALADPRYGEAPPMLDDVRTAVEAEPKPLGEQTVAAAAQIEFLRPARLGDTLTATAREDYRGRRNGYYTVEVHNQRDELIALFRGRTRSDGNRAISDT